MRVENIGTPRNIPDREQHPGLAEGDVLIAEVTDIKGDKVFLKNQDGGAVLTAKLLSDIGVTVGDYVETVVDETSGGRYVLRVVDISRQAPFATESQMAADAKALSQAAKTQTLLSTLNMLRNNPGADPKAAAFLSRHGLAGTAENIEVLSQMAKGPSPVTALLSLIVKSLGTSPKTFSQNGFVMEVAQAVPSAEAAIQGDNAHSAQSAGQTAADITGRTGAQGQPQSGTVQEPAASAGFASQAAAAHTVPGQAASAGYGQTSQTQAGPALGSPAQNTPQQTLPNQAKMPENNPQTVTQSAPADKMPSMPTAQSSDSAQAQAGLKAVPETVASAPQNAPQAALPDKPVTAAPNAQPQAAPQFPAPPETPADLRAAARPQADDIAADLLRGQSAVLSAAGEKTASVSNGEASQIKGKVSHKGMEIAQKALDMFVRIDDMENLATHIKKSVREMPQQLKELKFLADHADNEVRDTVYSKLEQTEKQMSLMSEVKRFDCYQIPLQTATQRQTTAELFVYRYRGGKKTVDPDNVLILLGLDTQYMGRVETLVKTSGKALNIEFNMEDMRLADEVQSDAVFLKDAVQQAGYTLSGISVKQLSARTSVLNAEERFEKETNDSAGTLDIRI